MEKTDQLPYQEAGEAAYWGTQLESLVRSEFTKRTGIEVKRVHQLLQSEEHPFMLANLDGICEHPDYGTVIFEAKPLLHTKPVNGRTRFQTNTCCKFSTTCRLPAIREPTLLC